MTRLAEMNQDELRRTSPREMIIAVMSFDQPSTAIPDASVRTGYNDEHKTRLLVKLMFGAGA